MKSRRATLPNADEVLLQTPSEQMNMSQEASEDEAVDRVTIYLPMSLSNTFDRVAFELKVNHGLKVAKSRLIHMAITASEISVEGLMTQYLEQHNS